jgi:hypothetical protein
MTVDLAKLPKLTVNALSSIKHQVTVLREPYKEKREGFHPLTLQPIISEVTVVPSVALTLDMPAPRTVRIFAHRTKPMSEPVQLREFKDADFDALKQQVEAAEVSWEEYIARVMNG